MTFSDLGLHETLLRKCESLDFTEPTPIQKQAIPTILEGEDLIGCAETGTGKTAAFLLPTIQKIASQKKSGVKVLIVAPTRELVSQITQSYIELANSKLRCATIIGGANINKQMNALRRGVSVIIATPGRLLDHVKRGTINLSTVNTLILDEADRMLDMGFLPAIQEIVALVPKDRQTLLFSATVSDSIKSLAYSMMNDPKVVEVSRKNLTARTVKQHVYPVAAHSKTALLLHLLEKNSYERVIIFTRTKRGADRVAHILTAREMNANRIHSNRSQSQREKALRDFKKGKVKIMVATDIASRGIDVEAVSHVVNYDVPETPEDYVHRIGRTGRAGNVGKAISLVTPGEEMALREIEKLTKQKVERIVIPEFGGSSFVPGSHKPKRQSRFGSRRKGRSLRAR